MSTSELIITISGFVTLAAFTVGVLRVVRSLVLRMQRAIRAALRSRHYRKIRRAGLLEDGVELGYSSIGLHGGVFGRKEPLYYRLAYFIARHVSSDYALLLRDVLRRIWWLFARLWWLAFVLVYLPTSFSNLYLLFADHGLSSITNLDNLAHAFRLDRLWAATLHYPLVVLPLVAVVGALVWVGREMRRPPFGPQG